MEEKELLLIGTIEINEAKRLKYNMMERKADLEIRHNEETCTKGCKTTVEVWIQKEHISIFQDMMKKEQEKLFDGLDINIDQINEVFDPEKEKATCPACGTVFSTKETECPDCGLNFA
ncbi:MAG: hypothetical protein ABIA04_08490 [Pseudomonadota bacterium]